ncbi:MAG: hypothetical protein O7H41_08325 [Planctomycetota bacterium]|nr:hypothetical protein [Planctomycetota bacterium]
MEITCDLYAQWIGGIRAELTKVGFDHSKLDDQDCAIRWQAWKRRTIPPAQRTVEMANGFSCPAHLQKGLDDLEAAIKAGEDIWPWQSKLIDRPKFEDGLYNDYGIVHFHLGDGLETSGYVKRTKELLFTVVDSSTVYEIGVYDHGEWYELDILDILDDNWPGLLDRVTLQAIDVENYPRTREEVKKLREANVVTVLKLKSGRVIAPPGGGVATDGTSFAAVHAADYWAKLLRQWAPRIIADIEKRVGDGELPSKDYAVTLVATDEEITAVLGDTDKWVLWRRS